MLEAIKEKIKKIQADKAYFNYSLRLAGVAVASGGFFLFAEHLYNVGLDPSDLVGHDWIGLGIIAIGGVITLFQKK